MKPSEIRIGNLAMSQDGNVLSCMGITAHNHEHRGVFWYGDELGFYESIEDMKPIPLTEEWLVKFGFENGELLVFEGYVLFKKFPDIITLEIDGNRMPLHGFKYVHQLQNLYFALTGEELTIK